MNGKWDFEGITIGDQRLAIMESLERYPDVNEVRIVGIRNSGTSCYAAAVMQPLMHIPRFLISALRCYPRTEVMKAIEVFILKYIGMSMEGCDDMSFPTPMLPELLGFATWETACAAEFFTAIMDSYRENGLFSRDVEDINSMFEIGIEIVQCQSSCEYHSSLMLSMCDSIEFGILEYLEDCVLRLEDGSQVTKQTRFITLPPVLCITLKGQGRKVRGNYYRGPVINQTLSVDDENGTHRYRLHSIIVYYSVGSGHYVSYIKKNDSWYSCDDSVVKQMSDKELEEYCCNPNRRGIPRLCMYLDVEEEGNLLYCDMNDPNNAVPKIRRVKEVEGITEKPRADKLWLNITTELDFNPYQLKFNGVTFRDGAPFNSSIRDVRRSLANRFDRGMYNSFLYSSLWLFVNGKLSKRIADEGKVEHLKSSDVLLMKHDDDITDNTILIMFVHYNRDGNSSVYLGCRVVDREMNVHRSVVDCFPDIVKEHDRIIWKWDDIRRTMERVDNDAGYNDLLLEFENGSKVIIETSGLRADFEMNDNCDATNLVFYVPDYFCGLPAPQFYYPQTRLFFFTIACRLKELCVTAPLTITWEQLHQGICNLLNISDWTKCSLEILGEAEEPIPVDETRKPGYLMTRCVYVRFPDELLNGANDLATDEADLSSDDEFQPICTPAQLTKTSLMDIITKRLTGIMQMPSSDERSSSETDEDLSDDVPAEASDDDAIDVSAHPSSSLASVGEQNISYYPTEDIGIDRRATAVSEEIEYSAKQKKVTRRAFLLSRDPPLTPPPLHPVRSHMEEPTPMKDYEKEIFRMASLQTCEISESNNLPITECNETPMKYRDQQIALTALHGRKFANTTALFEKYAEIVPTGPFLASQGRTGASEIFMCNRKNCGAHIVILYLKNGCKIQSASPHKCVGYSVTSNEALDEYIRTLQTQSHLTQAFMSEVRTALKDPGLTDQRIRRSYKRVHELGTVKRLKSWKLLPSLCQAVIDEGGTASIRGIGENVSFCGIMPYFCHMYVQSELFFPVVSIDGSFSCGLGRGVLLSIVAITGSRHILPLAWAWAISEDSACVSELIELFLPEERRLIASILSDEGSAILKSVREILSQDHIALCAKHREVHVSKEATHLFWKIIKAVTPAEYSEAKREFKTTLPLEYEKEKSRLMCLTKWETNRPRDMQMTNGIVESFNAMCRPYQTMEPFALLRHIYAVARGQIIALRGESGPYTKIADWILTMLAQQAGRMTVTERNPDGTFTIQAGERRYQVDTNTRTCSCKFTMDAGLPCAHIMKVCHLTETSWECYVHPRYKPEHINNVFKEIPASLDFTALVPAKLELRPPVLYSLKTKRKRQLGAMDMRKKFAEQCEATSQKPTKGKSEKPAKAKSLKRSRKSPAHEPE